MTAPSLRVLFDIAYLLCLVGWVGSILFFSFGVAPIIFKVLAPDQAAKFVRALFPRYYAWGATCGAAALPAFLGVPLTFPEYRGVWVGVQAGLILAGTLVMLYCGNVLTPAINAARDAGPGEAERFDRLHKRSVRLNGLVLLAGVALIAGHALRPSPRTAGMVEPSPEARLRQQMEIYELAESIAAKRLRQFGIDPEKAAPAVPPGAKAEARP